VVLQFALFILGATVVFLSGSRLPVYGSVLAERLGISATAIGLFVLAIITSLPELTVTLSAMLVEAAPDLALGNILGSNNFNITIIAGLEFALAGGGLLARAHGRRFSRTCILLLFMTAVTGAGVLYGPRVQPPAAAVLVFSVPLVLLFAADSLVNRKRGGAEQVGEALSAEAAPAVTSTRAAATAFTLLSVLVIAAGIVISRSASAIAEHPFGGGLVLGQTFVGTLLVAVATSLPEVTVATAAVRNARSPDMAVGTLLGSNSINIIVFAVGAPLLLARESETAWSGLNPINTVNVVCALALTLLVLGGLRIRWLHASKTRARLLALALVPVYVATLWLVRSGGG
jgi:cation:H+ antiporter